MTSVVLRTNTHQGHNNKLSGLNTNDLTTLLPPEFNSEKSFSFHNSVPGPDSPLSTNPDKGRSNRHQVCFWAKCNLELTLTYTVQPLIRNCDILQSSLRHYTGFSALKTESLLHIFIRCWKIRGNDRTNAAQKNIQILRHLSKIQNIVIELQMRLISTNNHSP